MSQGSDNPSFSLRSGRRRHTAGGSDDGSKSGSDAPLRESEAGSGCADSRALSVLAIDDNPTDSLIVEEQLQEALGSDYELVTAETLNEGMQKLAHRRFDVALLDLDLPDSVNRDIEDIKSIAPDLPLILLTGKSDDNRLIDLLSRGASDCVLKGEVRGPQLLRVIRFSLARRGAQPDKSARQASVNHSENDLRAIIEAGLDAKLVVGQDGSILFANKATERLFGRSLADLRTFPFGIPQVAHQISEVDVLRRDGSVRNTEMRVVRIEWHGKTAHHVTLHDRTEQLAKELEIRAALQDKERLSVALLDSNAALQQYAALVAHDLQAPLRGITSLIQLLNLKHGELFRQAGADEILDLIAGSSKKMQLVISGLLDLARVESDTSAHDEVDLQRMVDEVRAEFDPMADGRQPVIAADGLPVVWGNRVQIGLLMRNLISNGLKYQYGGSPRVAVAVALADQFWHVSVRDWGIGIPEKHRSTIFGLFQRLHGEDQYPGSGIGLAICERVVRMHGGKIWVESEVGKGSVFHFTLRRPQQPDHSQ